MISSNIRLLVLNSSSKIVPSLLYKNSAKSSLSATLSLSPPVRQLQTTAKCLQAFPQGNINNNNSSKKSTAQQDEEEDIDVRLSREIFGNQASSPSQLDKDTSGAGIPHNRNTPEYKQYIAEEKTRNGKLIYVGRLTRQLKTAKTLSLSSSILGMAMLPFLSKTLTASSIIAQGFVYGSTGFFIFVTPVFAQYMARRYVSRLYYNYEDKQFKAVMYNFFLMEYELTIDLKDLYAPDVAGVFSTLNARCDSKSKKERNLFIDVDQIEDYALVEKLLGYDKPFDMNKYKK